jgi:hypothetical protein
MISTNAFGKVTCLWDDIFRINVIAPLLLSESGTRVRGKVVND